MKEILKLKLAVWLIVLMIILGFSGCSGGGNSDSAGISYSAFYEAVLAELNYVRTNPSGYANERLTDYYNDNADNGAYKDLQNRAAVGALKLQPQLNDAAAQYANYLATHNVFGHYEKGTPVDRCQAAGYHHFSGENIAAGGYDTLNAETDLVQAAIQFVIMLVIDEGVADVGHRNNIMGSDHQKVGVGFARNPQSTYSNYLVQDFGSE